MMFSKTKGKEKKRGMRRDNRHAMIFLEAEEEESRKSK